VGGGALKNNRINMDINIIEYNDKERPMDKKLKLYFFLLECPQQGLNTHQYTEIVDERQ
jgi:hypothetical protein